MYKIIIILLAIGCSIISLKDKNKEYEELSLSINELIISAIHDNDLYLFDLYIPKIENINSSIGNRGTFLHAASEIGDINIVMKLLELGVDPLIKNSYGKYAHEISLDKDINDIISDYVIRKEIIIAANNKEEDIIKILLSKNKEILLLKVKNLSLLEELCNLLTLKDNKEIFNLIIDLLKDDIEKIIYVKKIIIEKGVNEKKTRENLNEYIDIFEQVRRVDKNYKLKLKKESKKSYVREAINKGYVNEFNRLINLEERETIALAVISEFINNNQFFINKFLVDNSNAFIEKLNTKLKCEFKIETSKREIKYKDELGLTELILAIKYGYIELAKILIEKEKNIIKDNIMVKTAIMFSYGKYYEEAVEKVLLERAYINEKDARGGTALMMASQEGYKQIAELLIKKGADANDKDNYGFTSIMLASENGHEELVKLLIEKGVDINYRNDRNFTALTLASNKGHKEVVKMLIKAGTNFNYENYNDYKSLIKSLENGHKEIVSLLIEESNNKNNLSNEILLMIASKEGNKELVKLLKEKEVDINYKNYRGFTALMIASFKNHRDVAEILIKNGANINNEEFKDFINLISLQEDYKEIVELFHKK